MKTLLAAVLIGIPLLAAMCTPAPTPPPSVPDASADAAPPAPTPTPTPPPAPGADCVARCAELAAYCSEGGSNCADRLAAVVADRLIRNPDSGLPLTCKDRLTPETIAALGWKCTRVDAGLWFEGGAPSSSRR